MARSGGRLDNRYRRIDNVYLAILSRGEGFTVPAVTRQSQEVQLQGGGRGRSEEREAHNPQGKMLNGEKRKERKRSSADADLLVYWGWDGDRLLSWASAPQATEASSMQAHGRLLQALGRKRKLRYLQTNGTKTPTHQDTRKALRLAEFIHPHPPRTGPSSQPARTSPLEKTPPVPDNRPNIVCLPLPKGKLSAEPAAARPRTPKTWTRVGFPLVRRSTLDHLALSVWCSDGARARASSSSSK